MSRLNAAFGRDASKSGSLLLWIAAVPAGLIVFFLSRYFYPFPASVDDSFIILRYATHLADGYGLSWNIGAPPDQGLTGIAWTLLLGAALKVIPSAPELVSGYLGIALALVTLAVFFVSLRKALPDDRQWLAVCGVYALAMTPFFNRHASNGMETILAVLVFAITVLTAVTMPVHRPRLSILLIAVVTGIAFLVRPDAPTFSLSVLTAVIVLERRNLAALVQAGIAVVLSVAVVAAIIAINGTYFITALPLPAYLKLSSIAVLSDPNYVLGYFAAFFTAASVWLVLIGLALCADYRQISSRVAACLFGAGVFAAYLLAVAPVMNFDLRFQTPLFIPIIFAGMVALGVLLTRLNNVQRVNPWVSVALGCILVLNGIGNFPGIKAEVKALIANHAKFKLIGEQLHGMTGVKVTSTEAGMLPYYSALPFLDVFGLTSTFVALNHNAPDYAVKLDRYMAQEFGYPDVYVRLMVSLDDPKHYANLCAFPQIISKYEYIGQFAEVRGPAVFILKGSAHAAELRARLSKVLPPPLASENGCPKT